MFRLGPIDEIDYVQITKVSGMYQFQKCGGNILINIT